MAVGLRRFPVAMVVAVLCMPAVGVGVVCAPGVEVVAVLEALAVDPLVFCLFLSARGFSGFAYSVLSVAVLLAPVLLLPVLLSHQMAPHMHSSWGLHTVVAMSH